MRFGLISILPLALAFAVADAEMIEQKTIEGIIKAFVLSPLTKGGQLKLQKNPWNYTFPQVLQNYMEGTIKLNGTQIQYGNVTTKNLYFGSEKTNTDTTVLLKLGLYLRKFDLKIGYDLDMALINRLIPIYGKGELNLAAKAIRLNFSIAVVNQDVKGLQLHSFGLEELSFKPDVSNLVGFLNNPEADQIFSEILNVGEEAFCLFYNLEKSCITCILQEIIKYIINNVLNNKVPLDLDCDCLKKKPSSLDYDLKSNLEGFVSTIMEGTLEDMIGYIFSDEVCSMWNDIYLRMKRLLDTKGLLEQLL